MKRTILLAGCFGLATLFSQSMALRAGTPGGNVKSTAGHLPALFQPNLGQAAKNLDYTAAGFGYSIGFSPTSANLVLVGRPGQQPASVGLRFVDANPGSIATPSEKAGFQSNYLVGKTSLTGIPNYGKLRYASVWPGVDLVYYAKDKQLEYDFVVAPNADPDAVRFRFEGSRVKLSSAGDLELETTAGQLVQKRAMAYQMIAGKRLEVAANYRLQPDGSVRLALGKYDRSQALVIDPVLVFQPLQFLNGLAVDAYVVTDSNGQFVYTASTTVAEAIVIPNDGTVYHTLILVEKFDSQGNTLANTQLGARDGDTLATGIDLDANGNVYITGHTSSPGGLFNAPAGTLLQGVPGGGLDSYLIKLSSSNVGSILYATFLGGNGDERDSKVAASKVTAGVVYISGQTSSTGWPTGGTPAGVNGFLYAIDTNQAAAASKLYALTLGGSGTDIAAGVATDASGNIYVAGSTTSSDFVPTTGAGYITTKGNLNVDGFVVKFNSGGTPIWNAFYPNAPANAIAQYANRYVYITGQTNNPLIVTANGYQLGNQLSTSANHAYFAKFDTTLTGVTALNYATYLAGSSTDAGTALGVSTTGLAYIGGWTTSSDFPVLGSVNPFKSNFKNGFVAQIDAFQTGALVSSSFYSTAVNTQVTSISVSPANAYVGMIYKIGTHAASDFDVSGIPDLIWQNDTTRQVTVNYYGGAGGAAYQGWNFLNPSSTPGWHVVAAADFNGDGVPDLVWLNDTTRQVTVNYYGGAGGATYLGWNFLNSSSTPGWHVVAAADFDGNGVPDLVWQNDTTRQLTVNYYGGVGGATYLGWNWLNTSSTPGWHVVAAADFNGDSVPDLVWLNDTTRQVTVNYYGGVGGATYQGWNWLNSSGSPGWRVVVAADFDGNGVPDLVWSNDTTHQVTVNYYGGNGGATYQGWNWLNINTTSGWSLVNSSIGLP